MKRLKIAVAGALCLAISFSFATAASDFVVFLSSPNDSLSIRFEPGDSGPGPTSKSDIRAYTEKIKPLVGTIGTQLLILSDYPESTVQYGKAKAIERADAVRAQLATGLGIVPDKIAIIPVARPGTKGAELRVELIRAPNARAQAGERRARLGWLPHLKRFVIICQDGTLPSETATWPDDFMIDRACGLSTAKFDERHGSGRVGWDESAGKWKILCPDGTSIPRGPRDPDDFMGLRRCSANQ